MKKYKTVRSSRAGVRKILKDFLHLSPEEEMRLKKEMKVGDEVKFGASIIRIEDRFVVGLANYQLIRRKVAGPSITKKEKK